MTLSVNHGSVGLRYLNAHQRESIVCGTLSSLQSCDDRVIPRRYLAYHHRTLELGTQSFTFLIRDQRLGSLG